ncbi:MULTISPECIES: hypothetical protein [unclassified Phyllobacterium]|nr:MULTISPECIES: hypothetical protein [unclassified Phyllobacterium]MBA8901312.1 hypothetical protein [Phyllobacterium sp. P30BS-XVII]UGX84729.1 hypothetical protein LLE53_009415 [Phyllobacterium sp. T1293]
MKLSMQMTITDLIRTLRWRKIELCEEVADASRPIRDEPKAGGKRKPER